MVNKKRCKSARKESIENQVKAVRWLQSTVAIWLQSLGIEVHLPRNKVYVEKTKLVGKVKNRFQSIDDISSDIIWPLLDRNEPDPDFRPGDRLILIRSFKWALNIYGEPPAWNILSRYLGNEVSIDSQYRSTTVDKKRELVCTIAECPLIDWKPFLATCQWQVRWQFLVNKMNLNPNSVKQAQVHSGCNLVALGPGSFSEYPS